MSRTRKIWLLSSLYLAQGLPFGFFTQALPVLLRDLGYSLTAIGATGLLFLPWALKFLWAPLVDARGTRRHWLLTMQLAAIGGALLLATLEIDGRVWVLLVALFFFNLVAATQDIATDGLAVNILTPRERGLGNGIQTGAYRIGMMLGGGLLLWVFAKAGWTPMFLGMAAMLALTVPAVLTLREAPASAETGTVSNAVVARSGAMWLAWMARLRQPGVPTFILLICFYKFGDSAAASLAGPYMRDAGMSTEAIALVKGGLGSAAALLGAALGGAVAYRFGRRQALLWGGLLQTSSLALYAASAIGYGGHGLIAAASLAEHVLGGMALVALFTLMMDASDRLHAGTDYTLFACAIVVSQGLAAFTAGVAADHLGYAAVFIAGAVLSGLGCLTLVHALDRGRGVSRIQAVWAKQH